MPSSCGAEFFPLFGNELHSLAAARRRGTSNPKTAIRCCSQKTAECSPEWTTHNLKRRGLQLIYNWASSVSNQSCWIDLDVVDRGPDLVPVLRRYP